MSLFAFPGLSGDPDPNVKGDEPTIGATKRYLAEIKKAQGRAAAKHAEHVLDAVYDLGAAFASTEDPTSDDVQYARSEVIRVRALAPS